MATRIAATTWAVHLWATHHVVVCCIRTHAHRSAPTYVPTSVRRSTHACDPFGCRRPLPFPHRAGHCRRFTPGSPCRRPPIRRSLAGTCPHSARYARACPLRPGVVRPGHVHARRSETPALPGASSAHDARASSGHHARVMRPGAPPEEIRQTRMVEPNKCSEIVRIRPFGLTDGCRSVILMWRHRTGAVPRQHTGRLPECAMMPRSKPRGACTRPPGTPLPAADRDGGAKPQAGFGIGARLGPRWG